LRGQVAEILPPGPDFPLEQARTLRPGGELGFIGTGLGTAWALEAADLLAAEGTEVGVLHVPVLKPLDAATVAAFAGGYSAVVTVENHSVVGALGSAVCEVVAESGTRCRVKRLGVPDRWAEAGPLDYLRQRLGLDGGSVAATAAALIGGR
jgi:transketolase